MCPGAITNDVNNAYATVVPTTHTNQGISSNVVVQTPSAKRFVCEGKRTNKKEQAKSSERLSTAKSSAALSSQATAPSKKKMRVFKIKKE